MGRGFQCLGCAAGKWPGLGNQADLGPLQLLACNEDFASQATVARLLGQAVTASAVVHSNLKCSLRRIFTA